MPQRRFERRECTTVNRARQGVSDACSSAASRGRWIVGPLHRWDWIVGSIELVDAEVGRDKESRAKSDWSKKRALLEFVPAVMGPR